MKLAATALVGVVALLHVAFLVLESFVWNTAFGRKFFKMTQEQADATEALARNQGLYNGFLAAGLVWSLATRDPGVALSLQIFFLGCVVVAGIVGAITAKVSILFLQALPAALALAAVWLARG